MKGLKRNAGLMLYKMDLFAEEMEQTAISRIQRFAKIAESMRFDVCLGFSGWKDSQVCYDLCKRSGIKFKAYFNHSFESAVTLNFIRTYYPEVIWRRDHKFGFIENIWRNHKSMLPTVQRAYCCADYKHNRKYVDQCSIVGVRKAESVQRSKRTAFEARNKTILRKNKALINDYFEEHCQSIGTASTIQLKPIIDWTETSVWDYIKKYDLPVNPEYENSSRVGCLVCPKANFTRNYKSLLDHPKLIDAFILAREKRKDIDWIINGERVDYSIDKPYYICRWLNHSFMPFSQKQNELYRLVRERYDSMRSKR